MSCVITQISFTLIFETRSLTGLELTSRLDWLPGKPQGASIFLMLGLQMYVTTLGFSYIGSWD